MAKYNQVQAISAGKLRTFHTCPYAYFLDEQIREANIPITGFSAKHYWLQNAFRKLFPGERHVGHELADIEDLRGEELAKHLKYHSADAFGNAMKGLWQRYIIDQEGTVHDRQIAWLYNEQWWKAAAEIRAACVNYCNFLLDEGPPILAFRDKDVAFHYGDKKFVVRFDAIRRGLVVCEQGTKQRTQKDLDSDWTATLQLLAFSTLARSEEAYRIKWGVELAVAESWREGICPEVKLRYYNLSRGEITETRRSNDDLPEMSGTVEDIQVRIKKAVQRKAQQEKRCCL
ncbi:MAG TPA: hypothetical protein HA230_01315 [Candidatus Aenigmarchaeota archaeon]|nr:hypothetical protein [Candidatus Aenigmarchaeota archaeon]